MMEALLKGQISEPQFRQWVRDSIQRKDYYAPLNTSKIYLKENDEVLEVPMSQMSVVMDRFRKDKLVTGKFGPSMERQVSANIYDPSDLNLLQRFGNKNFASAVDASHKQKRFRAKTAKNAVIFGMPALNAERAFDRYLRVGGKKLRPPYRAAR
jgi:hypothetical protein